MSLTQRSRFSSWLKIREGQGFIWKGLANHSCLNDVKRTIARPFIVSQCLGCALEKFHVVWHGLHTNAFGDGLSATFRLHFRRSDIVVCRWACKCGRHCFGHLKIPLGLAPEMSARHVPELHPTDGIIGLIAADAD